MFKNLVDRVNNLGAKLVIKVHQFKKDERGELSSMAWILGSAVVVVLIIVVFMTLAPETAKNMWNAFVTYALGKFGLN